MGDAKLFMPLWHTQKPGAGSPCNASLMVLEVSYTGVYPAATCTWGECYDTAEARSLASLMIWFLECARRANLKTFVEVLYDEKWHSICNEVDPSFIRIWLPIENDMQLAEFLEVANQSIRPEEADSKKAAKKRGRSRFEDEFEEPTKIGYTAIDSPKALSSAVMHIFMGLSARYVDLIELNIPGEDDEFRPKSPMVVFNADNLFNDDIIRRRWEKHRIPAWQRNLSNYVQDGNSFIPPHEARTIPGIMRQLNPEAPWIAHNGGTMDALLLMSPPHVMPSRNDIEDKLDERCRMAGADLFNEDFEDLSDDEFYDLFRRNEGIVFRYFIESKGRY